MFKDLLRLLVKGAVKGAAEEAFSGKVRVEAATTSAKALQVAKQVGKASLLGVVKYGLPGSLVILGAESLLSVECVQQIGSLIGSLISN